MYRYFLIIILIAFGCKGNSEIALNPSLKKSIESILVENQRVHDELMKSVDILPDTKPLLQSVQKAASEDTERVFERNFAELESTIKNIKPGDKEEYFTALSKFSEILAGINEKGKVEKQYNKFYCPMVAKYWIAKGTDIENPYAPEMRDCGELVKQ